MVEWKKLGDVCEIKTGKGITQKDCSDEYSYPVMSGGQTPMGMYFQFNREANTTTISRVGAYAGFVSFVKEKFYCNDKCFSVIPKKQDVFDSRFLYVVLKHKEESIKKLQSEGGVPTINTKKLGNILIPIPFIEEQQRIAGILDTFSFAIDNLKEQIAQRRKQFEYYRDQLLDLEGKEGVEMKISDFCLLKAGKSISANEILENRIGNVFPCIGGNGIRGYVSSYSHEGSYPVIGRQGALCGCVNWIAGKFYATEHAVVATGKKNTDQRFLYYLFENADLNQYKTQGAQPGLSVAKLNEVKFLIPSLSEQQRIVSILDTFEASIQNLEAQLSQREKQYEYYRNKLLTFE